MAVADWLAGDVVKLTNANALIDPSCKEVTLCHRKMGECML